MRIFSCLVLILLLSSCGKSEQMYYEVQPIFPLRIFKVVQPVHPIKGTNLGSVWVKEIDKNNEYLTITSPYQDLLVGTKVRAVQVGVGKPHPFSSGFILVKKVEKNNK